jgi:two-component system OmpR family response regulator
MSESTILIVEDEKNIASLVKLYLENEGFKVQHITDGSLAIETVDRIHPSLVILDLMLPGMDGLEICRRLRAKGGVPIIMLTARDQEVDKVVGLEVGADDYVTKPFSPRELVSRVKAVLRRSTLTAEEPERLEIAEVSLNMDRREVTVSGSPIRLTAKEFDLLAFLMRNRGMVFSRDRLMERVWDYDWPVDSRTVDSHVKNLRKKLGPAGDLISTIRGVGYKADA